MEKIKMTTPDADPTETPAVTEEPTDSTANKYQLAISHILKEAVTDKG